MFAWSIERGLAELNPVIGTPRREQQSRDRVLSDPEVKAVWMAAGDGDYGAIIRLLLLSGQRASEIGGLRWAELGEDAVTLPPLRTKNGRQHIIPLSDPALAILTEQSRRANADDGRREFVFVRPGRLCWVGI